MRRKIALIILIILIVLTGAMPSLVSADVPITAATATYNAVCASGRFIPCDGTDACPCNFQSLMQLISNVLNFLVNVIAFPLAVITFTYAGFLYMTTGVVDKRGKAKDMMIKVVIGFAVLLAANLIVKMVLNVLLNDTILHNIITF